MLRCSRDGSALHYVSKELKADRDVVLASVRRQIKMSTSTNNRLVASAASLFFTSPIEMCDFLRIIYIEMCGFTLLFLLKSVEVCYAVSKNSALH